MSRVLLFVQTGAGRPKCVGRVPKRFGISLIIKWCKSPHKPWWTPAHHAYMADRWWLVECENASHGRATISGSKRVWAILGRILAHGGRTE